MYEDIHVTKIELLKDKKAVDELLNVQVVEQGGGVEIERKDLEDCSVRKPTGVGATPPKRRGRPRKPPPPAEEVEKLKQAMLAKAQLQFALFAKTKKSKNAKNKQSRPLDFAQAWGERLSDPPQDRPPREGEEEVLEMHIGMVASNEYTEKDEHWLFTGDEGEKWIEANSLERLKVVTAENMTLLDPQKPLPPDTTQVLPVVLLYCRKRADAQGDRRYKCRAVCLGNLEKSSLPNYAPVISIPGVRLLCAETIASGSGITLFDLSNAFLNAELKSSEDGRLVVKLPESWAREDGARYAVLLRALYGLRIAPKRWFQRCDAFLKSAGWVEQANCLYGKTLENGTKLFLALYVDDVIIGGGTPEERAAECDRVFAEFPGKIISPVVLPGGEKIMYDVNGVQLEIDYTRKSFLLHQERYIDGVLDRFNMSDCKTVLHPRVTPELIMRDTKPSDFPVREALGCLIWLSTTARPDLTYDISVLARFIGTFGSTVGTVNAVKKVLRYLAGTRRKGLKYSPQREAEFNKRYSELIAAQCSSADFGSCDRTPQDFSSKICVFSGASFCNCPLTLRSQTGSAIYYRGCLIAYKTSRQTIITHSTMASEYVACSDTLTFLETLEPHLRLFEAQEIGHPQLDFPVFVDNTSAIRVARGDTMSNGSKHLKLRHVRVSEKQKQLFFCDTRSQEADSFTKSLGEAIYGMLASA